MCSGAWPNYTAWLDNAWGAGSELQSTWPEALFANATNLVFGQNPPYTLDDFQAFYPKFFGLPTSVANVTTVAGTATATVASVGGLLPGQLVQSANLPRGTVVSSLGSGTVTFNQAANVSGVTVLLAYESAPVPVVVIQLYINLATASLQQVRWQEQWQVAMNLFVAHYCTLYAKSDASEILETLIQATHGEALVGVVPGTAYTLSATPPGSALNTLVVNGKFLVPGTDYTLNGVSVTLTAPTTTMTPYATWTVQSSQFATTQASGAQIAAQGLSGGIQTSKSVGDVSASYQPLASLEQWGAWNLTSYGLQLATMAAVIGSGPMVIW